MGVVTCDGCISPKLITSGYPYIYEIVSLWLHSLWSSRDPWWRVRARQRLRNLASGCFLVQTISEAKLVRNGRMYIFTQKYATNVRPSHFPLKVFSFLKNRSQKWVCRKKCHLRGKYQLYSGIFQNLFGNLKKWLSETLST